MAAGTGAGGVGAETEGFRRAVGIGLVGAEDQMLGLATGAAEGRDGLAGGVASSSGGGSTIAGGLMEAGVGAGVTIGLTKFDARKVVGIGLVTAEDQTAGF